MFNCEQQGWRQIPGGSVWCKLLCKVQQQLGKGLSTASAVHLRDSGWFQQALFMNRVEKRATKLLQQSFAGTLQLLTSCLLWRLILREAPKKASQLLHLPIGG